MNAYVFKVFAISLTSLVSVACLAGSGDEAMISSGMADYDEAPSHHAELQQLDWLLGEWIDEGAEVTIQTTCKWDQYKNFLTRVFVVTSNGKETFRGHQIIGWDASRQQIVTWTFDSDGGFAEGVAHVGDGKFTINSRSTLPDGAIASSINIH